MTNQPKRPFHPRHLVCPRCGAAIGHPCVFAGKEQELVHCTDRLLAIGDPSPRVKPASKKKQPKAKSKVEAKVEPGAGSAPKDTDASFSPTLF